MGKLRWLMSNAPLAVKPHTVRNAAAADKIHGPITHIPDTISSKDLPKRLHTIVRKEVYKQTKRDAAAAELMLSAPGQINDPEVKALVNVPNPFIITQQQVEDFTPWRQGRFKTEFRKAISGRYQRVLMAKYPRIFLPPSPLNPLEKVPRIRWDEGPRSGIFVSWTGTFKQDTGPKGLYAGRTKVFKYKKHERAKPERVADIQERMDTMDERVAKWREVSVVVDWVAGVLTTAKTRRESRQAISIAILVMYAYSSIIRGQVKLWPGQGVRGHT